MTRRQFLRTKGALLTLPFLPSICGAAPKAVVQPPKRLVMMYVPNGLLRRGFFPGEEQGVLPKFVGGFNADKTKNQKRTQNSPGIYPLELTSTMQPLADHVRDITLVTGLDRSYKNGQDVHAQGASCYLTSVSPEQAAQKGMRHPNGRSLDQVIGDQVGASTPFNTLEISCNGFKAGKEGIYFDNISWYGPDKIAPSIRDPRKLYDRALTAAEVAASNDIDNDYVTSEEFMAALTPEQKTRRDALRKALAQTEAALKAVPPNQDPKKAQAAANRRFDDEMRRKVRSKSFERVTSSDPRYGGVITNAAMLSMTSGPKRTHPIARGAWMIEVIFNDPPPPPPNNVPPLSEDEDEKNLTIRERFAQHRENPDCAGCHVRLDPLGFALENFDITGRWRDHYPNGRKVDASGTLMKKHEFDGIVRFKESLVSEQKRFAKAFTEHLLRFALARELGPADAITVGEIVDRTEKDDFRMKPLIHAVIRSDRFLQSN